MWTNSLICYLKFVHTFKCLDRIGTIIIYIAYYIYFCYIQKNKFHNPILTVMDNACAILRMTAEMNQGQPCKPSSKGTDLMKSNFTTGHKGHQIIDCKLFRTACVHPQLYRRDRILGVGREVITFRTPKHINTLSAKLTIFHTCLPQCFLINCLVKIILENVLNNYSCTLVFSK